MSKRKVYDYKAIKAAINNYRTIIRLYKENNIPNRDSKEEERISIPFPRLTPVISESLVFDLLRNREIISDLINSEVKFSEKGGDLICVKDSTEYRIEVKSTGVNQFQYLSEKDINADYLLWVLFEDFSNDSLKILIFEKMSDELKKMLPESRKLTLSSLKKKMIETDCNYSTVCVKLDENEPRFMVCN